MPELIDPTTRLRTSFLAVVNEFRADRDYPVPWFVTDVDPQALSDPVSALAKEFGISRETVYSYLRPADVTG